MKLYYFYSSLYLFYHEHIQERLSNFVDLNPIVIDDINENNNGHHFDGLTIKLELLINAILQNMGEIIIFSDATIFVHNENGAKLEQYIMQYKDYDLVFVDESANEIYNIGFITVKCSEKTLNFFKEALNIMNTKQINHDQASINFLLNPYGRYPHVKPNLKFTVYGEKIYCDYFRDYRRNDFIIYKSFISNKNKKDNFNQRIQIFYNNSLIDKETYDKWFILGA
jgi:hypothetical protein